MCEHSTIVHTFKQTIYEGLQSNKIQYEHKAFCLQDVEGGLSWITRGYERPFGGADVRETASC
jgi:hypothetical protein